MSGGAAACCCGSVSIDMLSGGQLQTPVPQRMIEPKFAFTVGRWATRRHSEDLIKYRVGRSALRRLNYHLHCAGRIRAVDAKLQQHRVDLRLAQPPLTACRVEHRFQTPEKLTPT
jgi:hypothetical protein